MGKLEVFSIPGVEIWFWSADHIPPHFHVKKAGEWEIRVHREALYEEWCRKTGVED